MLYGCVSVNKQIHRQRLRKMYISLITMVTIGEWSTIGLGWGREHKGRERRL